MGLAENISFGDSNSEKGKRVVLQLLVDDGVPSRGHRKNMFSPDYNAVGIATGPHSKFKSMTTMDFAKVQPSKNTSKPSQNLA